MGSSKPNRTPFFRDVRCELSGSRGWIRVIRGGGG